MTTLCRIVAANAVLLAACVAVPEQLSDPQPDREPAPVRSDSAPGPQIQPNALEKQDSTEVPANPTGSLRQVQLLEVVTPASDAPGRLRIATSSRLGPGRSRIEIHDVVVASATAGDAVQTLGAPSTTVDLDFDVFEAWARTDRRAWRVLDIGGSLQLVIHDPRRKRVRLIDVASSSRLFERDDCLTFEDARVRDGGVDLIVRSSEGLRMIELSPVGSVRGWRELSSPDPWQSVAAFVAGAPGEEPPHEAIVAGYRAGYLVAVRADLIAGTERSFVVEIEEPEPSVLRVAAWGQDERRRIAIGMPGAFGYGRVALVSDDVGQRPAVLHDLFAEGVTPDVLAGADMSFTFGFGVTLGFTADAGGDGLPELAVLVAEDLTPDPNGSVAAALVDHATGAKRRRYVRRQDGTERVWTSSDLSVDPSGRFVAFTSVGEPTRGSAETRGRAFVVDTHESPVALPALRPAPDR